ncbi:putative oxidoreductase [Gracilariopsis chorda]|uniref:Putative oxidoreductase n=1 Tax=Gracilariopsis chorda TaxID=448386 RepID=A0A2V3IEE3_9FLOR|nr:putative oxidoreductase [Gracilariopsis chorda]|eukprot:PXF40455.1 putative oxidoreductase [Gracilariopsis chorda]
MDTNATSATSDKPEKTIAIIGAGIIGASIAYNLSLHDRRTTIFEQCAPACAASGKSGGFLAKDWCDSSEQKHLARPSFDIHRNYAKELNCDIGYRPIESYSVSLTSCPSRIVRGARRPAPLAWLDGTATVLNGAHRIGTQTTNAQVLPKRLTEALLQRAEERVGSSVVVARVTDVQRTPERDGWQVHSTNKNGTDQIDTFDIVVLAMGPWTIKAKQWFPNLPAIMAHKAASVVIKAKVPPSVLFTEYVNIRGEARSPEAYPRVDEVYLCQSAIAEDLADDPDHIHPSPQDVRDLIAFGEGLSSDIGSAAKKARNVKTQACNLPISPDGLPVIGAVSGTDKSVFVATGHSCWGILNSAATGKAVAELIVRGRSTVNVRAFDPARFGE